MQPETILRNDGYKLLRTKGWWPETLFNNAFQKGIPDSFIFHREHGFRWIDWKISSNYSFTKAQRQKWPLWEAAGIGIWILTAATEDEYQKLFEPPNWRAYWKPSFDRKPRELLAVWEGLVRECRTRTGSLLSAFTW